MLIIITYSVKTIPWKICGKLAVLVKSGSYKTQKTTLKIKKWFFVIPRAFSQG